MKNYLFILFLIVTAESFTACKSPEVTSYRLVGSTVTTVDSAMQAWGEWVRAGRATPDDEAKVRQAYDTYQASMRIAHAAVISYKTNNDKSALEQALLATSASSSAVIKLIQQLTQP